MPTLFVLLYFAVAGLSERSVVSAIVAVALAAIASIVDQRTSGSMRAAGRVALASAVLFLLLVVNVASWDGDWRLGILLWLFASMLVTAVAIAMDEMRMRS